MTEGEKTSAAIYIVRSGQVVLQQKIKSGEGKTIKSGGYFGEGMLEIDIGGLKKTTDYVANYTIKTLADPVVVGILSIESCRNVIDTTTLGKEITSTHGKNKW